MQSSAEHIVKTKPKRLTVPPFLEFVYETLIPDITKLTVLFQQKVTVPDVGAGETPLRIRYNDDL
jgi:hypothetical protein